MKITRWKNLASPSTYDRALDNFFTHRYRRMIDMDGDFTPAINTLEKKDNYTIEVAAPGLQKDDFNITVDKGVLTISCERNMELEDNDEGYLSREFSYSSFSRSFSLPSDVNEEEVNANYKDGILRITLPRERIAEEKEKAMTIDVH